MVVTSPGCSKQGFLGTAGLAPAVSIFGPYIQIMKILIHSHPGDAHSIAGAVALGMRGHDVWRDVGFDLAHGATFELGNFDGEHWRTTHAARGQVRAAEALDVVWFRRPVRPAVAADVHAADRGFVAGEWSEVTRGFNLACGSAFWVNPLGALSRANNKPTQLAAADRLGMTIPATMITNNVDALASFLDAHDQVIFKPLHGALWEVEGKKLGAYTTVVTREHLSPPERIRACPGIFQARVEKAFEVRAQFFGRTCFAVRIDSQQLEHAQVDWRRERGSRDLSATPIELPEACAASCLELMSELGIVSGAFDFIVTPDNEWVFLEVNEAGQFIFLEMWCPQLPVLDGFVRFLESGDAAFQYQPRTDRIVLDAVFKDARFQYMLENDNEVHGSYRHPGVIAES